MIMDSVRSRPLPFVRERRPNVLTLLRANLRGKRDRVLVGECADGSWASTAIALGKTINIVPLRLATILGGHVKRLYEVDVAARPLVFGCDLRTEEAGSVLRAEVQLVWNVGDPVRVVSHPPDDHLDRIQSDVEEELVKLAWTAKIDDQSELLRAANELVGPMRSLKDTGLRWGGGRISLRLNTDGIGYRDSIEEIRRSRAVDRERRSMQQERIDFYTNVIHAAPVSMLAMWLSQDGTSARDVLEFIQTHHIDTKRVQIDADAPDPVRDAITALFTGSDEFQRNELRLALLDGLRTRNRTESLNLLRDALALSEATNGNGLN